MASNQSVFPHPSTADEHGLVAVTRHISSPLLVDAYKHGLFPWPLSDAHLVPWFSPDPRGLLFTDQFQINRNLRKTLNKNPFRFRFDQNFEQIVRNCADPAHRSDDNQETWITEEIVRSYSNLHRLGLAYCLGAYMNNQLVAGLYGVSIGHYVSAESMFTRESNASKACVHYLCQTLRQAGIHWVDIQMVTPVLEKLGGVEVDRQQYLQMLDKVVQMTPQHCLR